MTISLYCQSTLPSAFADHGSNQTVMSLIVLPNEINTAEESREEPKLNGRPVYVANTRTSILRSGEKMTYRVWISI